MLAILDGWGISKNPNVSAISNANTPFFDHLMNNYPNAELLTHGNNVGLPDFIFFGNFMWAEKCSSEDLFENLPNIHKWYLNIKKLHRL